MSVMVTPIKDIASASLSTGVKNSLNSFEDLMTTTLSSSFPLFSTGRSTIGKYYSGFFLINNNQVSYYSSKQITFIISFNFVSIYSIITLDKKSFSLFHYVLINGLASRF